MASNGCVSAAGGSIVTPVVPGCKHSLDRKMLTGVR